MKKPLLSAQQNQLRNKNKLICNNFSFSLHHGDCIAICGHNGVGKTTLLKWIAKQARFNQDSLKIALMPDRPIFYPHWQVSVFLNWHADFYHCDDTFKNWIIDQCGLRQILSQKCAHLSHGYQQRLSLATTLLMQPNILLLDEPMNGLDAEQRDMLKFLIRQLSARIPVIFSHHDYADVSEIANRIFIIQNQQFNSISLVDYQTPSIWIEWQDSPPNDLQALHQIDCYTQHKIDNNTNTSALIQALSLRKGLVSISRNMPAGALHFLLDNHHD